MVTAGVLIGLNAVPSTTGKTSAEYGWPLTLARTVQVVFPGDVGPVNLLWYDVVGLIVDGSIFAIVTVAVAASLEFLIRWRKSFTHYLRDPVWRVELDGRAIAELSQPIDIDGAATSYRVDPLGLNSEERAAVFRALFYVENSQRLRYRHVDTGAYAPPGPAPTCDAERGSRRVYFTKLDTEYSVS